MLETVLQKIFVSQWIVLAVTVVLLLAAAEFGFRLGLRLHCANDEARKGQIGGIQGAVLGLLALLLGFTFAMAVGHHEVRRQLVLQEANAIGTTNLRAALLPEVHAQAVESLLKQYVDTRLEFYAAGHDNAKVDAAETATAKLQRELWTHAIAAGKEMPNPVVATFITSLNETIDLDAARYNELRTHVPGAVWLLVLLVAMSGCCLSGYAAGATGARTSFAIYVLPLLIAIVIALIADLDRARGGLIGISQQPLVELKRGLEGK